jgi:hypothetical protein
MAFQISPGVNVSEVDLTTVVPAVTTTAGGFAGYFNWGPAFTRITIADEPNIVRRFGGPDSNSAVSFFTAASFLAYSNNIKIVRAIGGNSRNAIANTNPNATNLRILNENVFQTTFLDSTNNNAAGAFAGRYCGALGNSLSVSLIDAGGSAGFATWNVNGIGVSSYFPGAPGTSSQAASLGATNDEVHVIVLDTGGVITGTKNTVLEVYPYLSKGSDAIDSLGNSNYYKEVIFNQSRYIYAVDPVDYANTVSTWGRPLANTTYATITGSYSATLTKGLDELPSDANTIAAFSAFTNPDDVDIGLVITGAASTTVQQYVIDNVATVRKDCIAFITPPYSSVVNQPGIEASNIITWTGTLARSTSYAVADCAWKYMFDKYNNVYRWIPLNADTAGLCAYTDTIRDPWYSPAGYNRGQIKNVVKLSWNPNKTERDTLYSNGVNPVIRTPSAGTILYGDKTLQIKPSAFDRINVRRLFIVLEKTISQAAQYSLFEFNDEFTRAQFVALVTPFLRDVQGRRGIYDFRVVCDTTNNTPQVIDSNQFIGDIYIKPARAINFIQLNFVAVRTGVDFNEIVGAA